MNSRKLIILCSLFIIYLYGCQNADEKNAALIRQLNPTGKFILDTPFDECRLQLFKRDEELLGLDSLTNGFDSIQIRIWWGCALEGSERFIILRLASGKWQGESIDREYHYSDRFIYKVGKCWVDCVDSVSRKVNNITPKSGWQNFITKLFELNVLSLPQFERIQTPDDRRLEFMDGCGVTVQIATIKIDRIYTYQNPDYFSEKYREAKNIIDIATLLNFEFGVEGKWPMVNPGYQKNKS